MNMIKRLVPMALRIELRRFVTFFRLLGDRTLIARHKATPDERKHYTHVSGERVSRIEKHVTPEWATLQKNKKKTLLVAAKAIDGLLIRPGETFSLWKMLGRPSVLKGYADGFEIQNGKLVKNMAGGVCQLANAICYSALLAGMTITERHRHALDLFADDQRDVPFGSGATVLYNYQDLRFRNDTGRDILLESFIADGSLHVRFFSAEKIESHIRLVEKNAAVIKTPEGNFRKNEIWRITEKDGHIEEELIFTNEARMLYDPEQKS